MTVLDLGALENLLRIAGGDEAFVDDLLRTYVDQADGIADHLRLSAAAGDVVALRRWAHTLKGASLAIGATDVASLCRDIEIRAANGICAGEDEIACVIEAVAHVAGAVPA